MSYAELVSAIPVLDEPCRGHGADGEPDQAGGATMPVMPAGMHVSCVEW